MLKRPQFRFYGYLLLSLFFLMASWDANRTNAAVVSSTIPQESIRLRILANSDAPQDQWIKRDVRDAVIEEMNQWIQNPMGIEQAREEVRSRLGDLHQVVGRVLAQNGYYDEHQVELGVFPFPAKMYGDRVYPAGDYEALLITIGRGQGQNWWCVLFPPLCFVDAVSGEAAAKAPDGGQPIATDLSEDGQKGDARNTKGQNEVQIRFFVWDLMQGLGSWFKGLFA